MVPIKSVRKLLTSFLGITLVVFVSTMIAKADSVTITPGNHPQPDEENILLTGGDTGNPIFGVTNQTQVQVRFTSDEDILSPPQGQARIVAADGALNYLMIDVPNGTFGDLILNINALADGEVRFRITTTNGVLADQFFNLGAAGENFFTILAAADTRILSVEFWSDSGMVIENIDDVHQIRISGVQGGNPVPEPATMLLLGTGLVGVAARLRSRRKH